LVFLLLTKRPSNINKYIPIEWKENPPKNVWFGTSPVNQATANKLIPELQQVNGNRFLSIEPQLNAIDLNGLTDGIGWIIQGGESGGGRRPFDIQWAYDMKSFCEQKQIPYFFKQIDKVIKPPQDLEEAKQFPKW
jgi:protein gp37